MTKTRPRKIRGDADGAAASREGKHVTAETQRAANEQQRVVDEGQRQQAEAGRVNNERQRQTAEHVRDAAVVAVRKTARELSSTLEHMERVEQMRRSLRTVTVEDSKPD